MGMLSEFKEFAMKGSVVDLAVGVIIGGAFGKIVDSLVNDVIMPPIGLLISGIDFKSLSVTLAPAVVDATGKITKAAVLLNYGSFINNIVTFIIVAFVLFQIIKTMNHMKAPAPPPAEPATPEDVLLLREIRDSLKK